MEKGWFFEHQGGNGMLQCARGVIDGSPKNAAYPFNPDAGAGYTEGWVAFNTAWNSTLAYLFADGTEIQVYDSGFGKPLTPAAAGDRVGIRLRAPLDFDYARKEQGQILAWSASGDSEAVSLTEPLPRGGILEGTVDLVRGSTAKGDRNLQVSEEDSIFFSYGLEGFATRHALPVGKPSSIGEAGSPPPASICRALGVCLEGSSGKVRIHDLRGRALSPRQTLGVKVSGLYLVRQAGGRRAPWSKLVHLPH